MWGAIKKAINSNLNKSLDVLIQEKATETNDKVDNRASQTSVDGIDTKIGATNNVGGTASAGSIFAKLNKLLTDWTTTRAGYLDNINTNVGTLINGRVVKSVQYGMVTPNPNNITVYESLVSHAPVDLNKSIILINSGVGNFSSYQLQPFIQARTSNSFTLRCSHGNISFQTQSSYSWQLIEFY